MLTSKRGKYTLINRIKLKSHANLCVGRLKDANTPNCVPNLSCDSANFWCGHWTFSRTMTGSVRIRISVCDLFISSICEARKTTWALIILSLVELWNSMLQRLTPNFSLSDRFTEATVVNAHVERSTEGVQLWGIWVRIERMLLQLGNIFCIYSVTFELQNFIYLSVFEMRNGDFLSLWMCVCVCVCVSLMIQMSTAHNWQMTAIIKSPEMHTKQTVSLSN